MGRRFLWIKFCFFKEGRLEKFRNTDFEALAQFVDDSELHGIVGAVDQIADGGLRNAAFGKQLILGHVVLF